MYSVFSVNCVKHTSIVLYMTYLYNYYYCSVPCKCPLSGKCPCTGFHGVNVTVSIQMYGTCILGKRPSGSSCKLHWSANGHLPVNVHCMLHSSKVSMLTVTECVVCHLISLMSAHSLCICMHCDVRLFCKLQLLIGHCHAIKVLVSN